MNKQKRLLALLINGVLLSSLCMVASAADTATGTGNGIAYGTGSVANNTKDIAIGKSARVENYVGQNASIAIGNNAHVENMSGGVEASLSFDQTPYSGNEYSSARIPADLNRTGTGIAIGNNTYARTGSTMVGNHNYVGKIGDVDMNTDTDGTRAQNLNAYSTTIGTNSFSNGALTTNTGTFNIMSSSYTGGRFTTPSQNFGSTITGTLNSIESKTAAGVGSGWSADKTSVGVANTISGVANRTANTNGSLVYGAGNEITNSIVSLGNVQKATSNATEFAGTLRDVIKNNNGGGATMAFGGGNKADYTLRTSMIGINNTVTGANRAESADNLVMGVGNTGSNVQHLTAIGSKNTVSDATSTLVFGDNRTVTGANHTVILGSSDNGTTTTVNDAVAVGHNTEVSAVGGAAIGSNSKATVAAGAVGYDILTNAPSTDGSSTWKSTASAVSVGDVANNVTRQITSVAAGTNDTDAVNVAQLKQLRNNIGGDITNINGNISRLDKRVNKAVAGSAALAALHPLDFDPDAKWDFAAGYGHYHNGNAAALGAFYRPNEDVQLSVGSTVGNGETVVNAGLSVKVGAHSNVSRSRVAIGKEVLELKKTVALQNAQIQKLTTLLNGVAGTNMKADRTTLFPDVPSNHWAYEAVSDLSRLGLVEGYPDGTFGGDRMMTRYEFAQIVYRAIQNGAQVNEQLVTEFSPEMALFRVDTVAKNHQGQPIIERVRVNKNNI